MRIYADQSPTACLYYQATNMEPWSPAFKKVSFLDLTKLMQNSCRCILMCHFAGYRLRVKGLAPTARNLDWADCEKHFLSNVKLNS